MEIMISVPSNMADAIIGGGLGYELSITGQKSEEPRTLLTIPIKEDWQLPYIQFIKNMIDKFDN